jgi:O6-methylguanine-DNA--protein-cysteine methyltransferase
MVLLWVEQAAGAWYGVAELDGRLAATVAAESRGHALRALQGCLPEGMPRGPMEEPTAFALAAVRMLADLEAGREEGKRFELSPECFPGARGEVLRAAAGIPIGWVSAYGDVARAAATNARVVGRLMATNQLYPIVACHRVVGADLSLVGYGGRQTPAALGAKLERLRAEARGFTEPRLIDVGRGLRVVPVEWVLTRAARDGAADTGQLALW